VDKKDFDSKTCSASLKDLSELLGKKRQHDREFEAMNRDLEALNRSLEDLKGDKRRATREYKRELREAMTEGGCVECLIVGGGGGGYSGQ
jgi:DnaJ-domain-containing protein 1